MLTERERHLRRWAKPVCNSPMKPDRSLPTARNGGAGATCRPARCPALTHTGPSGPLGLMLKPREMHPVPAAPFPGGPSPRPRPAATRLAPTAVLTEPLSNFVRSRLARGTPSTLPAPPRQPSESCLPCSKDRRGGREAPGTELGRVTPTPPPPANASQGPGTVTNRGEGHSRHPRARQHPGARRVPWGQLEATAGSRLQSGGGTQGRWQGAHCGLGQSPPGRQGTGSGFSSRPA